jgi:IclR family transcriptional regulator, KDG regulon repressor
VFHIAGEVPHMKSLRKAIKIIELMSQSGTLRVSEVADLLEMNRIFAHRCLATLCELGYVAKSGRGAYEVTYRLVELSAKITKRSDIVNIVKPYLQELGLTFNETVNLGHWNGREIIHIDKFESKEILRIDSPLGSAAPAYCTGLGKAILAFLPEGEIEKYLSETKLVQHGLNTITNKKGLRQELEKIRLTGVATDNQELVAMLVCVAAPIFDHTKLVRYAVSISGPISRMTPQKIEKIETNLKAAVRRISLQVGGIDPLGVQGNGRGKESK